MSDRPPRGHPADDPTPDDGTARLRIPPHNREAEQSVLGALLLDNSAFDRVGDLLVAESFYVFEHRLIFEAIGALLLAIKPADPVTVLEQLERMPATRSGAGEATLDYLEALRVAVPSASNARRYAEIVAERAIERRMVVLGDEIATLGFSPDQGTAAQRLDKASSLLLQLEATQARSGNAIRPLSELAVEYIDAINDLHEKGKDSDAAAWPTPLESLNRVLGGGMRPGRVYVLAARPSIGKSALAQAFGVHFALNQHPTLFLSQEMPAAELTGRIVSQIGGVDFGHLQNAEMNEHDWGGLSYGVEHAAKLPFYIDETPALTIGQIRAKARSIRGLQVLVVDYLQLTASNDDSRRGPSNRNAEIEQVSRGLKQLAKELNCAVILLSQLNREVDKRPGGKPTLTDLRDSGAIEQDADVVIMLWRLPTKLNQSGSDSDERPVGVFVPKNRSGRSHVEFPVMFNPRLMRWNESELPMTAYSGSNSRGEDKEV